MKKKIQLRSASGEKGSAGGRTTAVVLLLAILLPASLTLWPGRALSAPPAQGGPRPTVSIPTPTPGPGGPTPSGPGAALAPSRPTGETCANASGQVILWGSGGIGDVGIGLDGGGWRVEQVSASDGSYNLGALGEGVGILEVHIGQEAAKTLRPMVNNVAVRLSCDFHPLVNIGLYSTSRRPQPPGEIWMSAEPRVLKPGGTISYHLLVRNSLPTDLSRGVVTDLLPEGLKVLDVTASRGEVEVLDGRMVTVYLGTMASGEEAQISIKAKIWTGLEPGSEVLNSAALFYAESAADQDWISLPVGALEFASLDAARPVEPGAPAATGEAAAAAEEPAATPAAPVSAATPAAAPATEQETAPEGLPVSGWNLALSVPAIILAGVVMFLLARGFFAVADSPERD